LLLLLLVSVCAATPTEAPKVMVLGDSLSANYGLEFEEGWVSLLQNHLVEEGYPHRVANESISGDTTRSALNRLSPALERHRPEVVIVELGGNDGLRGLSLKAMRGNLAQIIERAQGVKARVLLLGMRLPPNYGPAFSARFQDIYEDLASEYGVSLVPFFLEGVGDNFDLMQADGIHPNAEAQPRLLQNVLPKLVPLL
jgi:acyl-CoA thioesterase-1